jgi:protein phosphatase
MLTNCLGGQEVGAEPDVKHLRLQDNDRILLCTDGLSDVVKDEEMLQLLAIDSEPNATCQALIDLALDRGGPDNVTALLGHYQFKQPAKK